ncbi:MAG: hypothetical protein GC192_19885 [Bacteroidetes bacterium]|nr:hypothetical protein [Bacteroidota bacterium]
MKKLLLFFFLLALIVIAFLFLRGNRPNGSPATISEQPTENKVDAAQLYAEFMQDEAAANEKYLNKITEILGVVSTVTKGPSGTNIILRTNDPDHGIHCRMEEKPGQTIRKYEVGQSIRLKCLCSGYIQEVELVQCVEK